MFKGNLGDYFKLVLFRAITFLLLLWKKTFFSKRKNVNKTLLFPTFYASLLLEKKLREPSNRLRYGRNDRDPKPLGIPIYENIPNTLEFEILFLLGLSFRNLFMVLCPPGLGPPGLGFAEVQRLLIVVT